MSPLTGRVPAGKEHAMSKEKTIPITIGVTGHRAVREEDREALYAAVMSELKLLRELYPNSPFVMLNSLAEGADRSAVRRRGERAGDPHCGGAPHGRGAV